MKPLRLLLAPAAVLLIGSGLQGTHAAFTDSETFEFSASTGSLAIERDGDGLVFDSSPLAPGDTASGTFTIANKGTLPAELRLTTEQVTRTVAASACDVRDALQVAVAAQAGGQRRPLGEAAVAARELPGLGTLPAGETRTYAVTITYAPQGGATSADNDNCFQGAATVERFTVDAVEAH
jgi:predicted ribosomally synthesized peptide with SipW-like signal peptide